VAAGIEFGADFALGRQATAERIFTGLDARAQGEEDLPP